MKTILVLILLFSISPKVMATDPPMQLYDEGVYQGTIFRINCVGTDIVCTRSGITGIITIGGTTSPGQLQFLGSDLTFGDSNLTFNP